MKLSALLMSVAINSILCVVLFGLYSVLRKQPKYYKIYIPRKVAEGSSKLRKRLIDRVIPSAAWISKAWHPSEQELLESSGLDAIVFMRMITLSFKIFLFAGIIGLLVLLPVNCIGDKERDIDFKNWSNNSLDLFTISNVKAGSEWLWFHFGAVYLMTAFVCCLLYLEFKYITLKRICYFYSSHPQPHHFTVLVRGIPTPSGASVNNTVARFFSEFHSSTYLSHVVVRRTGKLRSVIADAKKLYKRLVDMKSAHARSKNKRVGRRRPKEEVVGHYEKLLGEMEHNVRVGQTEVSMDGQEVGAAFVSFKSRYGAAVACHMPQSIDPTHWVTEPAPEPYDVYWPFFSSSFMGKWISKIVVITAFITLTILFLIPVLIVQGLTNLDQLKTWLPFLEWILTMTFVSQIITGYLPNLILQLFLKTVPPVMEFLSSLEGYICHSDIDKSACCKVIAFTIWNVFFATVFSGSALNQINIFLDPKNIPQKLGSAVPAQASFFVAYVVTSGWTSTLVELFRVVPFISYLMKEDESPHEEFKVPFFRYHKKIPKILFFGLLGMTYFFLAPLILPFLLLYLGLAYTIYRNQFLSVYAPRYETAGKFWPIIHYSTIFSLVLMQAIAIGIFTIKKKSVASTLTFPLPVLTLLFNEYCRKRFLPVFLAYPTEVLVARDKEDEHDATMREFYNSLVTAYQDPALLPIHYSASSDSLRRPLLA